MRRLALAAVVCACSTSAGGPDYAEVEVRATAAAAGASSERFCVTLPVLPGARTEETYVFDAGFRGITRAEREEVEVSFEGIQNAASAVTRITADELNAGYSRTFPVRTAAGAEFTIVLTGRCTRDAPDGG